MHMAARTSRCARRSAIKPFSPGRIPQPLPRHARQGWKKCSLNSRPARSKTPPRSRESRPPQTSALSYWQDVPLPSPRAVYRSRARHHRAARLPRNSWHHDPHVHRTQHAVWAAGRSWRRAGITSTGGTERRAVRTRLRARLAGGARSRMSTSMSGFYDVVVTERWTATWSFGERVGHA